MSNASGRSFDNGDIFYSDSHDCVEAKKRNAARVAASRKRFGELLAHRALIAREWNLIADEAMAMGPVPRWWQFRARRRWFKAARHIIEHWQIWRDAHGEIE